MVTISDGLDLLRPQLPLTTKRENEALALYFRFFSQNGDYPTIRVLSSLMGLKGTGGVKTLHNLEKKGYLTRDRKSNRLFINKSGRTKLAMLGVVPTPQSDLFGAKPTFQQLTQLEEGGLSGQT